MVTHFYFCTGQEYNAFDDDMHLKKDEADNICNEQFGLYWNGFYPPPHPSKKKNERLKASCKTRYNDPPAYAKSLLRCGLRIGYLKYNAMYVYI